MDELVIDFETLTVGEIDLIEDEINARVDIGRLITFSDVAAQFDDENTPETRLPFGKVLRAFELVALRKTNPNATWEDTGKARLAVPDDVEVVNGKVVKAPQDRKPKSKSAGKSARNPTTARP